MKQTPWSVFEKSYQSLQILVALVNKLKYLNIYG